MEDAVSANPTIGSRIAWVFIGKEGLRAGWSLLLFFAIAFVFIFGLSHLLQPPKTAPVSDVATVNRIIIGEALSAGAIFLAAFIMSLIERRAFSNYGTRRTNILPDLSKGLLVGFAMLSLLVGIIYVMGGLVFDGIASNITTALAFAARWAVAFALVALFEEFMFRGYVQFTLARGVKGIVNAISKDNPRAAAIGFWVAGITLSVVLFAVAHASNGGETLLGLLGVSLAGFTFVFSYYWTGSLWWAIGFHAAWNWAQTYFYGVADSGMQSRGGLLVSHPQGSALVSGGTTGPEASVLLIPVLLLTLVIIWKLMPRRPAPGFEA